MAAIITVANQKGRFSLGTESNLVFTRVLSRTTLINIRYDKREMVGDLPFRFAVPSTLVRGITDQFLFIFGNYEFSKPRAPWKVNF